MPETTYTPSRAGIVHLRREMEGLGYDVLYSEQQLQERIRQLAEQIEADYHDREPYLVGILKGAAPFMTDLMRQLDLPLRTDWMAISSYGAGTRSSGVVRLLKDLDESVESRHVLLVEDIVDSGRTLSYIMDLFRSRKVASLKVVTLLDRPDRREVEVAIDYTGFNIPDVFVVGYGMDLDQKYRNVPFVFTLRPGGQEG
ncbi:MAG TPA: hypoxanthine phosphoribosyltransferase [bacterium]|nr:hypoxanthine phosphoribosyltransferase [bacterium]